MEVWKEGGRKAGREADIGIEAEVGKQTKDELYH